MRLDLIKVRKTFNKTIAVEDLNLTIAKGTVFGMVGPNGAGKTTTLRMIMNILKPDSGQIIFDGNPISSTAISKIGYLPEERGLYLKANLLDTAVYLGMLKGLSQSTAAEKAKTYFHRFDLVQYMHRKIEELSKGNQQKVQFIIAILHDPELLILDEPFSGLDPVNQLELKRIIGEFHASGKTVVFSTHQMEQVEKLCQDVCMIHHGKRVLYGNLKDIRNEFGVRKFRIHYSGKQDYVRKIAAPHWTVTGNMLSGELQPGLAINDILTKMIQHVTITQVELEEASLEQIFIDRVKEAPDA